MAAASHRVGGDDHYQQRVWKVSDKLDRLAMLCEQHHLQTKHVDGLPDWTTPRVPAGVKNRDHDDVPPNFAWAVPKNKLPTTHDLPAEKTLHKQDVDEELEKQSEALRESTRSMLSRLSLSSTDSFSIAGGQSTRETVRPVNMSQHSTVMKPVRPIDTFQHIDLLKPTAPSTTASHVVQQHNHQPRTDRPSSAPSTRSDAPQIATPRHALEPHRRRKVHFADHGRSYRGTRPKNFSNLTYQEALRALDSRSSSASQDIPHAALTTYRQNFQWPRRENLEKMMDRVGGQTAGGETRYEPRRVFTAEDAIEVAKESAIEFQVPVETRNRSAARHAKVIDKVDSDAVLTNGHRNHSSTRDNVLVESAASSSPQPAVLDAAPDGAPSEPLPISLPAAIGSEQMTSSLRKSAHTTKDADDEVHRKNANALRTLDAADSSDTSIGDGGLLSNKFSRNARTPSSQTREDVTRVPPTSFAQASTQTDQPKPKKIMVTAKEPNTLAHHADYCSHCGRSGEPAPVEHLAKRAIASKDPSASARNSTSKTTVRSIRAAPPSRRPNPIFANARYPAEPSVFRGKTTYSTEFGSKRHYRL